MNLLERIDQWIFGGAFSPTLMVLGFSGLISIWLFAPAINHVVEKWFGAKRKEFSEQFASLDYQQARQDFAWNVERAYRKKNPDHKLVEFKKLLDSFQFPIDFPPPNDAEISEYARNLSWPKVSKHLWFFFEGLFRDALEPNNSPDVAGSFSEEQFLSFLHGRRITSKFWDDWAREIVDGRLTYKSIEKPIDSNRRAIKALAIAELALAHNFSWDPGPGKISLFKLALGPDHLKRPNKLLFWKHGAR